MATAPARREGWFASFVAIPRSQDKERRRSDLTLAGCALEPTTFWNAATDTNSAAYLRDGELHQQTDRDQADDLAVCYEHADELEELIPQIADMSYLKTVLAYVLPPPEGHALGLRYQTQNCNAYSAVLDRATTFSLPIPMPDIHQSHRSLIGPLPAPVEAGVEVWPCDRKGMTMAQAMGPTYAGGTQPVVKDGYAILYLPDVANRDLIAQGEAPVFYYVPNQVRMARKDGPDKGDYLFNLVRFAGTGGDGVVGGGGGVVGGDVAGGVLTFSVTGALPEATRAQAEQQITAQFADSDDAFWGIKGARKPPMFRPAIITSSTTSVSNVSPTPTGLPGTDDGSAVGGMPGNRSVSSGAPRMITNGRPQNRPAARRVRDADPASQPTDSNLSPWYWMMQGQGAGSIDPTGTHAFSGLLGVYPTAICWQAFHGTASPLIVIQNYKLKVWSPVVTIKIDGNWDSVFNHFSASASGHYLWASADIKAEFNSMRKSGTIKTEVLVDTTLPNAEAIAKRLEEKSDLVFQKFMEMAQKFIFEPPTPTVPPAEASSSGPGGKAGGLLGTPWGVSVALKYRRDENHLDLHYEETQQFAYLQDHTISSSLAGMFDEMKADPGAERKYFLTVNLDGWPRRMARVVRPVVPWSDGTVQFVTCQVGYPNQNGEINWEGHSFAQLEGNDGTWKFQTVQKEAAEVSHPPQDWTPDMTFVKRQVHLAAAGQRAGRPL